MMLVLELGYAAAALWALILRLRLNACYTSLALAIMGAGIGFRRGSAALYARHAVTLEVSHNMPNIAQITSLSNKPGCSV
jgi:hypothetical protein